VADLCASDTDAPHRTQRLLAIESFEQAAWSSAPNSLPNIEKAHSAAHELRTLVTNDLAQ